MSTIITVRTAALHVPISFAGVFINGVGQGFTDASGHLTLSLINGPTYTLTVKATGYQIFSTTYLANQSLIVDLVASIPSVLGSFLLTIYPETSVDGRLITFSNSGAPISQPYQLGGLTVSGLTVGTQIVTASIPGYQPVNTTFDISQAQVGTIQLSVIGDTGIKQASITQPVQDPDVSLLLPALTNEDLPEFIAPNTGQGTYFTMTQARMYVGGIFIDELNSLQFVLQNNKIPIYGYASREYDIIAQGKALVQGQFAVNFISEGYLVVALQEYQQKLSQSSTQVNKQVDQQQQRLLSLVNRLQNPDPAWTPDMYTAAKSEISNLAASLGPAALVKAKAGISQSIRQQNNSLLGLAGGDYPNSVYEDLGFDIVIEYTGAGRTITRRLEDCRLISNEMIMDHSGTPILDSYGFIARRLR